MLLEAQFRLQHDEGQEMINDINQLIHGINYI